MPKKLGLTYGSVAKRIAAIDFQFNLFKKCKLEVTLAERNHFVLKDECADAIKKGVDVDLDSLSSYKLVRRESPISIFERGRGYGASFSYAGVTAGLHGMTRDEAKLFLTGQMVGSVEVGETPAFGSVD